MWEKVKGWEFSEGDILEFTPPFYPSPNRDPESMPLSIEAEGMDLYCIIPASLNVYLKRFLTANNGTTGVMVIKKTKEGSLEPIYEVGYQGILWDREIPYDVQYIVDKDLFYILIDPDKIYRRSKIDNPKNITLLGSSRNKKRSWGRIKEDILNKLKNIFNIFR